MTIDCTEFCRALGDDTRQRILVMLQERELCVSEIVDAFRMTQPTISHHLSVLRQAGLVTRRREGQQVYYGLDRSNVVDCCGKLVVKLGAEDCCSPL